jgi:hypothetical protein
VVPVALAGLVVQLLQVLLVLVVMAVLVDRDTTARMQQRA